MPVSEKPYLRALVAFVPLAALMLSVELTASTSNKLSSRSRWRISRIPASQRALLSLGAAVLLHLITTILAVLVLLKTRNPTNTPFAVLRLLAGAALLYAVAGFIFNIVNLILAAAGYRLPDMHRTPIAARSVGEFWSRRWNIIVSAWLRQFIFYPALRQCRPGLALILCFAVSGLLHSWPILVALDSTAALSTLIFFILQGIIVLAEKPLHVGTWPSALARTWTITAVLGPASLYIDPCLRLFGF